MDDNHIPNNNTNFQNHKTKSLNEKEDDDDDDDDDHDHEETLSLSDFPLKTHDKKRRSSSEPSDFFEFFTDFTSVEMSSADDIIFCGKLVPYTYRHQHHQFLRSLSADDASRLISRANRLDISSHDASRNRRSPKKSDRSFSKRSERSTRVWRPRWFVLMFGPLKLIQPEMDLREMRSRQVRRNQGRLFAGGETPAGRRGFWGVDLLRVLSCKNHASVAVTACHTHVTIT